MGGERKGVRGEAKGRKKKKRVYPIRRGGEKQKAEEEEEMEGGETFPAFAG